MSDAYSIWIVTPPGYAHSAAFSEVALGLQGGLREIGIQAPIVTDKQRIRGKAIVLGANLLPDLPGTKPPRKCIILNLEQITPRFAWLTRDYLKLLKRHNVWDYSLYNIEQLGKLGIDNVTHCPIGFSGALCRIDAAENRDIDVLFYGSVNERRQVVLDSLSDAGLRVETLFGVYGETRDSMIARSKIVLNVHYYPAKIFEIVRISWLLANRVCVVSETSPLDSALASVQDGIVQAPCEALAGACSRLIEDGTWEDVARQGFEIFSRQRQSDYLRDILLSNAA